MHKRTTILAATILLAAILIIVYLPAIHSTNVAGAGGQGVAPTRAPGPEDMTMVDPGLLPFCPDDPINTPASPGGCKVKSSPATAQPGDVPISIPYPSHLLQMTATAEAPP